MNIAKVVNWPIVLIGAAAIGAIAGALELLGNPPNKGICVVCFERDLALAAVPDKGDVLGGPGPWGQAAVVVGILFCVGTGLLMRRRDTWGKVPCSPSS